MMILVSNSNNISSVVRHPTKSNLSFSLFFPRGTAGPSDDQRFRVLEKGGMQLICMFALLTT